MLYALFVSLGILAAAAVRRVEVARLGYGDTPGHAWIGVFALAGAAVGSKLGMVLFQPPAGLWDLGVAALGFDFTGKTVVGGIAGGHLGVEIGKKLLGIRHSTGDAFAVSLPLAQGVGRVGCWFNGCCPGAETTLAILDPAGGRHPVQLYESALDLLLAGSLWSIRTAPRPAGHLFRFALLGYATIRFGLEPIRGDRGWVAGPFTAVQWVCLIAAAALAASLRRPTGAKAAG